MSDERKNAFKCDQMQQCESFHFYDENGKIIFGSLAEGWLYQNKQ